MVDKIIDRYLLGFVIKISDGPATFILGETAGPSLLGTLRNEDLAIGRRLLLRHLITTSWQKESLYLIPTQMMKTAAETCLGALSKWG